MRSLFIVSLPRSLSSVLYHAARDALRLESPGWVSDGEVLNTDRYVLSPDRHGHRGLKYMTEAQEPGRFTRALEYLDTVTRAEGHIYKDVVNPFVVARWPGLREFRLLRISRDVADIALALMSRGWDYPETAVPDDTQARATGRSQQAAHRDWQGLAPWLTHGWWVRRSLAGYPLDRVLAGLMMAEAALAKLPGEVIDFDLCVQSPDGFAAALQRLYPGTGIQPLTYMDDAFRRHRDEVLSRRGTPAYREIRRRVERLRSHSGWPG